MGSARRLFMARTVKELEPGGQRRAERELGWNRETIRKGMHELQHDGQNTTPKRIPESDAIFEQLAQTNQAANATPDILRISMDAKATVKIDPFARSGKSRVPAKAADHDFQPTAIMTPVGILLVATDELFLYQVTSY